jgi:microcystin-dependent protein
MEYGKLNITPSRNDNGCGTRPAEYNYNVTQKSEAASGGDEETRPKNLAVFFIIKARMVTDAGTLVVPPVGAVLSYAGNATQPAGDWLLCNGAAKERSAFAALFGCIGTIYGETGPSNFKLPDYRGMFLRGIDGTSSRTVGNLQDWATALPQAATTGGISLLKTDFGHLPTSDASKQVDGALYDLARLNTGAADVALSGTNGGDKESRPCNLSVDFHVRANAGTAEDVPVGTVIACGTHNLPGGNFRLCDGTLLQKAENEALFAAIGTLYGGDASRGEFHIPDYRGLFLRGANRDSSNDPDAPSRQPKGTGTPQEPGSFQDWATGRPRNAFKGKVTYLPNSTIGSHGATASNRAGVDGNKTIDTCTEGGNAETRPRNVAVAFFIKLRG